MKNYLVSFALLSLLFIQVGCKSKQQTVALSGAHIEAGRAAEPVREMTPVNQHQNIYEAPAIAGEMGNAAEREAVQVEKTTLVLAEQVQPEEVRDEKFSLDVEEKNTSVINLKYHVVVGSFKNRNNAKNLQQTLNNEGNNAVIVVNEQEMYRVLIASFNEYADARGKINQINKRFPDAWVLVQKD